MTKLRIPGRNCEGCNESSFAGNVEVQDEGNTLGTASILDFEGAGVTATKTGGRAIITIPGGGASTSSLPQYIGNWDDFETDGFPTTGGSGTAGAIRLGDHWRLNFSNQNAIVTINSVDYTHNTIIEYAGSGNWASYPINYANSGVPTNEDNSASEDVAYRGTYIFFETLGFPTTGGSGPGGAFRMGDHWRLQFTNVNTPVTTGGVDYYHNSIIEYAGSSNWISYSINYGN